MKRGTLYAGDKVLFRNDGTYPGFTYKNHYGIVVESFTSELYRVRIYDKRTGREVGLGGVARPFSFFRRELRKAAPKEHK